MGEIKERITDALRGLGADLVGIASLDRFDGVRAQEDPRELFPEARTLIVIGRAIPRGALRGMEEGTNWTMYNNFAGEALCEYFVPSVTYHATRLLEDLGWEAIPIYPHPPATQPQGVAVAEGRAEPNVIPDVRYAAGAAGLGEIGRCGLVLTPRYGTLQRFNMIVTDAEIEPDAPLERPVCDQCGDCVAQCPHGALSAEAREVTIAGKTMLVSELDVSECVGCGTGERRDVYDPDGEPDRIPAACGRACLAHLHAAGLLEVEYRTPFRVREPWSPQAQAPGGERA